MKTATSDRLRGITWNFSHLKDGDFTDDGALISRAQRLEEKTDRTGTEVGSAGLGSFLTANGGIEKEVLMVFSQSFSMQQRQSRAFKGRCLRPILHIRWGHKITNEEVARTDIECIVLEVKKGRWRWLGHILIRDKVPG